MVLYSCNPSTQEPEAGLLRGQFWSGLHSNFKASLGYIHREKGDNGFLSISEINFL